MSLALLFSQHPEKLLNRAFFFILKGGHDLELGVHILVVIAENSEMKYFEI